MAFSITEAREAAQGQAAAAAGSGAGGATDSDSEGEEYALRLAREDEERAAQQSQSRLNSRRGSMASSPASPLGRMSPMRRQKSDKNLLEKGVAKGLGGAVGR